MLLTLVDRDERAGWAAFGRAAEAGGHITHDFGFGHHEKTGQTNRSVIGKADGLKRGAASKEFNDGCSLDSHAPVRKRGSLILCERACALREKRCWPPIRDKHGLMKGQFTVTENTDRVLV